MKTSPEGILVYILLLVVEILIHISGVLLPLPLEYLVGLTAGGQVAAQQLPYARAQAGRHAGPAHLVGFKPKFQFFRENCYRICVECRQISRKCRLKVPYWPVRKEVGWEWYYSIGLPLSYYSWNFQTNRCRSHRVRGLKLLIEQEQNRCSNEVYDVKIVSQPDTAVICKQLLISNERNRFAELLYASQRMGPLTICWKISAWIAEREAYRCYHFQTTSFLIGQYL